MAKIRLCEGFSSQCRGRENTARKSNKKNPRGDNLFIITPGRVSFPENPLT
ncbi:hypothetical protein BACCOPRO_01713 [Phocaeicola coprophilus DSM 18228 = JCM 13818]|uniref:Uncharacterized protein n=1 Tax=Phocaeicola coprophilus DSM 18228 = JCM 13818 TaxID=547042 RepID=S0F7Z4_9BACT|nr:hypothetical protein BACCOPRO_01713 [Phocaeicola coprophilus DSM 18228 = JCM 13818]